MGSASSQAMDGEARPLSPLLVTRPPYGLRAAMGDVGPPGSPPALLPPFGDFGDFGGGGSLLLPAPPLSGSCSKAMR